MLDVMIDLETMSTKPNAAIVAIGAVEFDLSTRCLGQQFYAPVSLASAVDCGGLMDADTVLWWLRQSDAARAELYRDGRLSTPAALVAFAQWLSPCSADVRVWGNGADFDCVVLRSAFDRCCMPAPWHWANNRCFHTMRKLCPPVELQRTGTHHNALDDAVHQARQLLALLPQGLPA